MLKLVKHSRVSKQPGEIATVSNSSPVNKRMKWERTTWNISNRGTLASDGQGSNLLLIPNGGSGALVLSPSLSLKGPALVARSTSLLAQNNYVIWPMASGLSAKISSLKDLPHRNNAPVDSTAFGGFVLRLQHGKAEKAAQLLSDGDHSDGDVPQPPTLQAPPLATAQDAVEVAIQKNRIPNVEIPPQLHPSPRIPKFISVDVARALGLGAWKLLLQVKLLVKTSRSLRQKLRAWSTRKKVCTCYKHLSIEYASRQRVRTLLSFRRRTPRPIAGGQRPRARCGFSTRHGWGNARSC